MMAIGLGCWVLLGCWASGAILLHSLKLSLEPDEELVYGLGLGLGFLSYGVLVLGLAHQLTRPFLLGLGSLFSLLFFLNLKGFLRMIKGLVSSWKGNCPLLLAGSAIVGGIAVGAALLGSLAPETANDSLCYHFHLPKLFLREHRIGPFPYEINSLFPFLMEMFCAFSLGITRLDGEAFWTGMSLAKFLHFFTGVLTAGALFVSLRKKTGKEPALWAALLFLTTPAVINQMGTTYVDVGLACFTLLAVMTVLRWVETKEPGWLVLSGIFSGFMLSVKYLGVISIAVVGLYILIQSLKQPNRLKPLFLYLAPLLIFSSYWYVRAYLHYGNPVYPYFYSVFKSGDPNMQYNDIGFAKTLINLVKMPWFITMRPDRFEGFGDMIGPAYLAFLPSVLFAFSTLSQGTFLLGYTLFYFVAWFFLAQSLRFYLPALPVLSLLIGQGLSAFARDKRFLNIVRSLVLGVLVLQAGIALYHYRGVYRVALGRETPDNYLTRVERSYPVAKFINENLPPNAKVLNAFEVRAFYFNPEMIREDIFARWGKYDEKVRSVPELVSFLKTEGFTHILFAEGPYAEANTGLGALRVPRLLHERENGLAVSLEPIYTYAFTSSGDKSMNYILYRILP